jgi:hypothetical protein
VRYALSSYIKQIRFVVKGLTIFSYYSHSDSIEVLYKSVVVKLMYFDFYCEGCVKDPFTCLPGYSERYDAINIGI